MPGVVAALIARSSAAGFTALTACLRIWRVDCRICGAGTVARRLLTSAIHVGYMLLGIAAHTSQSGAAVLYYALTYALTTVGAFGVIAIVERSDCDGPACAASSLSLPVDRSTIAITPNAPTVVSA